MQQDKKDVTQEQTLTKKRTRIARIHTNRYCNRIAKHKRAALRKSRGHMFEHGRRETKKRER